MHIGSKPKQKELDISNAPKLWALKADQALNCGCEV